jgi:hypothetical protein
MVHNTPKRTPPHKQTLNINKRTQQSTPPTATRWERRSKQAAETCAVVTNAGSRQSCNSLHARTARELLHHGTVTLRLHIHDRRSLSVPVKLHSANTPNSVPCQPLILTSLRGGLASSTASLLCQDSDN